MGFVDSSESELVLGPETRRTLYARAHAARIRLTSLAGYLMQRTGNLPDDADDMRKISHLAAERTGIPEGAAYALLTGEGKLPPWRMVRSYAAKLGASKSVYDEFINAHRAALDAGRAAETGTVSSGSELGRLASLSPGLKVDPSAIWPKAGPSVVEDLRGHECKPNPLDARSFAELEEKLREYWHWAGRPGSRIIAVASGGAFSHATIAKLLSNKPGKPSLKQSYVCGLIRGCGGDEEEQQRWVTAWRRIDQADRVRTAGLVVTDG
jgi:hypothetical protein